MLFCSIFSRPLYPSFLFIRFGRYHQINEVTVLNKRVLYSNIFCRQTDQNLMLCSMYTISRLNACYSVIWWKNTNIPDEIKEKRN